MSEVDRRQLLCGGCAAITLASCSGRNFVTDDPDNTGLGVDTGGDPIEPNLVDPLANPDYPCNQPIVVGGEGWTGIQIANHPELDEVGGAFEATTPGGTAYILVQVEPGCYVAVARACTHQGRLIDYDPVRNQFVCPLHASIFDVDGSVVGGPAVSAGGPLAVYFAGRDGDQVWVKFPD